MGLTFLLAALIVLACIMVVFIGKQAKRVEDAYIVSFDYVSASRPEFIWFNDDEGKDLIINSDEIEQIISLNGNDDKYIIRLRLKNEDSIIDFAYNDKLHRDYI